MKLYIGTRNSRGCVVTVHDGQFPPYALSRRLDLANHSPTGFEWGYGGSGPAQLALAILADFGLSPNRALRLHQRFKFSVIGNLSGDHFELTGDAIRDWLAGTEAA
jgi:hypothetical protein